jgi:REP element-mobilizing transposase RayT
MAVAQIRNRGRLPHWETEHGIYFVTFRLADSLPRSIVTSLETKFSSELDGSRKKSREIEKYIDGGGGACYLKTPAIADLVADTLRHFDGVRYRLFAWCIMPNHLHVVFQPTAPFRLEDILHSWKSYSGLAANKKLGRRGEPFWQREYYDHLIQGGEQFRRAVRYTAENPLKAGLTDWRWVYVAEDLS